MIQKGSKSQQLKSEAYHIAGAAYSAIGGRPDNQDCCGFGATPLGYLALVCDGMGGGPAGRIASSMAVKSIFSSFSAFAPDINRENALKMALSKAETELETAMQNDARLEGMGTTVIAVLLNEQSAMVACLGDSRCYQLRGGKSIFRTADQSIVGELVRAGVLTEEQARTSPQSNVITASLGASGSHEPVITERPYLKGDRFVLCTDGVWGSMPHPELLIRFGQPGKMTALAERLSAEVDQIGYSGRGHHDNHSFVIFELGKDSKLKDKMSKWYKVVFAVLIGLLMVCVCINFHTCSTNRKVSREIASLRDSLEMSEIALVEKDIERQKAAYEHFSEFYEDKVYMQEHIDSLSDVVRKLSDSIELLKTKDKNPQPVVITNNIKAKEIAGQLVALCDEVQKERFKTPQDANKVWPKKKQELKLLIGSFRQVVPQKYHSLLEALNKESNNDTLWFVDREKKNGYHYHTKAAQNKMKHIKEQVQEIQKKL